MTYEYDPHESSYYNPLGTQTVDLGSLSSLSGGVNPLAGGFALAPTSSAGTALSNYSAGLGSPSLVATNGGGGLLSDSNLAKINMGISGIRTLGGLYTSLQQLNLAKRSQALAEKLGNANLANSVKSYNTALSDKAAARYAFEGKSASDLAKYVESNKLST